jgi:SPP1 gp7 family putative phage head morphogenesis protein
LERISYLSIPLFETSSGQLAEQLVTQAEYAARLEKIAKRVGREEKSAVKRTLSLLRELQREIRMELATVPEDQLRVEHLRRLLPVVNARLADYTARLQRITSEELEEFYHLGSNDFDEILEVQGFTAPFFGLPRNLLDIAQDFSAELITDISEDLRRRINRTLRLGVLRGDSPFKVMKEIGGRISRGAFRTAAQRAETIARTELLRMYSVGHWARMQSTAEQFPDLRKRWVSSHDPRVRPSHARADGQVVRWDKPFIVGGYKAMFPRDPRLPPEESVNCRCIMVPVPPEEFLGS